MAATGTSYLAFVPQHAPTTHGVLAVVERGDGPEAEPLFALPDARSATMLASALNGVLRVYPAYWVNLAPYALFLG